MSNPNPPLLDYQVYCKDFIKTHHYCGLFLPPGLGKTLITLSALHEIQPQGHILIIAPKNIAKSTWLDEIIKWGFPFRTQSLIIDDKGRALKPKDRHDLYQTVLDQPPTVYFINRELIGDLVTHPPVKDGQAYWPYPNVILDESHSFKSYKSQRFKYLKSVRPYFHRLIELTGTPVPNGLLDLWSQIYLLDGGYRLGKNISRYRNAYFRPTIHMNGIPVKWQPLDHSEEIIYKKIQDLVISMDDSHLNLPDRIDNYIKVYMDPPEEKVYKTFAKNQVQEFADLDLAVAANAGVLANRLTQMASGSLYTGDGHEYVKIHEKKLEHVLYLIENSNSPVLIAYHYKSDKDMLLTYLTKHKVKVQYFDGSPAMQKAWNRGKIPVMIMQPASTGEGLNIQEGGHTLIWYTLPWSLKDYIQCNARLHRKGQKNAVIIHHLITAGTIDVQNMGRLKDKNQTQESLIEAVKVNVNQLQKDDQ